MRAFSLRITKSQGFIIVVRNRRVSPNEREQRTLCPAHARPPQSTRTLAVPSSPSPRLGSVFGWVPPPTMNSLLSKRCRQFLALPRHCLVVSDLFGFFPLSSQLRVRGWICITFTEGPRWD